MFNNGLRASPGGRSAGIPSSETLAARTARLRPHRRVRGHSGRRRGPQAKCLRRGCQAKTAREHEKDEVAGDERSVTEQTTPAPAPTRYLGLDGTGVAVRPAEVEGRRGQPPDGSAKAGEVKLAAVWTAAGCDTQGRPVRDRGSVSYNAAIESAASRDTDPQPAAFAQRVYREAIRRGFDTAAQRVVIGDGAAWIWNPGRRAASRHHRDRRPLPRQAAPVRRPPRPSTAPGTDLADRWGQGPSCRTRRRPAPRGRRRVACHVETTPEARTCIHYVFGNRHRMRYPQFRARGFVRLAGRCRGRGASRSAHGSSAPACAGPSPAPTPSSPCAAPSSAAASRDSWERRAADAA